MLCSPRMGRLGRDLEVLWFPPLELLLLSDPSGASGGGRIWGLGFI